MWTFQHRPSLRPSPGVRELVQLASPGWQHRVTRWFPPPPLRSCPCETSAASAGIQPPTPPGAKRWGLSALSSTPPSVVARGRRGSGAREGRLPDPSLFLLPAPSARFSPTPLGKAGAGESPRAHLCRMLVTHLEPQSVWLKRMPGRGPDLPKITHPRQGLPVPCTADPAS